MIQSTMDLVSGPNKGRNNNQADQDTGAGTGATRASELKGSGQRDDQQLFTVSLPTPNASPTSSNNQQSQPHADKTLRERLMLPVKALRQACIDIAYVSCEAPATLYRSAPLNFLVSSAVGVSMGAQRFALTWAGATLASVLMTGGKFGAEYLWPCVLVVGALEGAQRLLGAISNYQTASARVVFRKDCTARLIDGVMGQRLATSTEESFTQASSIARNNQWVPYNLGNFFYPVLQQASALTFMGYTIVAQAPQEVLALAAGMIVPSIVATFVSTHLATVDEERFAKPTSKANKLAEYLTSAEHLRTIQLDRMGGGLKGMWEDFFKPGGHAETKRAQISFYLTSVSGGIFAASLVASLYRIGSEAITGHIASNTALLLTAAVVQFSTAVSELVNSVVLVRIAAPYLRALRDIERTVESPGEEVARYLDNQVAAGLKLNDISIKLPAQDTPMLRGVTITIEPGKVTSLFGPQGCGKTTLLDFLAGLRSPEVPHAIQVIVGEDVYNLSDIHPHEWIRSIGFCSQHPLIYPVITLRQNITAETSDAFERPEYDQLLIDKLLEFVGKPEWREILDSPVGAAFEGRDFSGGEKQLIALMRALYKKPKLLFLDEAFTNLPQQLTQRALEGIRNLTDIIGWQPTVVMVTHDTRQNQYADSIVLISAQKKSILGRGSHAELIEAFSEYREEAHALRRGEPTQ